MNLRSTRIGRKGVVKISNRELSAKAASCLALIAPSATLCIIRDYTVTAKHQVPTPVVFEDVARRTGGERISTSIAGPHRCRRAGRPSTSTI